MRLPRRFYFGWYGTYHVLSILSCKNEQHVPHTGRYNTGHRSQVIVLPIQKVSQTLVKANLRTKNFCVGLIRPVTCDL